MHIENFKDKTPRREYFQVNTWNSNKTKFSRSFIDNQHIHNFSDHRLIPNAKAVVSDQPSLSLEPRT